MQITNGVHLHFINTKKFKDIGISVRFCNALEKKSAPLRSLLALMLCDRSALYDTKQKMSAYQDTLYGLGLSAQTAGYGNAQIVDIKMKVINPTYLQGKQTLLQDALSFLHEIIFQPLLNEDVFQESRQILCAKIERMLDEPSQYAISTGLKMAGKGTPLGISAIGEKEDIVALTLEDVQRTYEEMLKNDMIDIMVCGDINEQEMTAYMQTALPFAARNLDAKTFYCVSNDLNDCTHTEYRNISQSYIMMTWFTNTSVMDPLYYPLRVANAMLGQYSTSLLFQEVREKNSLCYSIFSNLISYDGALGVTTGVEKENVEKTIALIDTQFQRLCSGDFDDDLLRVSKQMIMNSLKASDDHMNSLIALCYQNRLLHTERKTQDIIALIDKVQKDEVVAAMAKCVKKMTLIVTGRDEHETIA